MKKSIFSYTLIAIVLLTGVCENLHAQGVAVYRKNGTVLKIPYEELDRIEAYDLGNEPVAPTDYNGHEYVDLGLPSGTKWYKYLVGQKSEDDKPIHVMWGEIEDKGSGDWKWYSWCNGTETTITKYCLYPAYGKVDKLQQLEIQDDIANHILGGDWRMPTKDDVQELIDNCTIIYEWPYLKITGPNGNFLSYKANSIATYESNRIIWTSTLSDRSSYSAYCLALYYNSATNISKIYLSTVYRSHSAPTCAVIK